MPKEWCDDEKRRKETHIPEDIIFKTKPQLARQMLERVYLEGLSPDWVLGDSVYGSWKSVIFSSGITKNMCLELRDSKAYR